MLPSRGFGGKSRIAPLVWRRFGNVPNYIEPFAGSLAVLLGRPSKPRVETVNDKDAYLANFWRALKFAPSEVAEHASWPVNEADLHARHQWLVTSGRERVERLCTDPEYFDAQVAGWWVWGLSLWIGDGWCAKPEWRGRANAAARARGIHKCAEIKRPALASVTSPRTAPGLLEYFAVLAARLQRVRVCVGDWSRVLGPAVTTCVGVTGIFLDPPYHGLDDGGRDRVYTHDDGEIWNQVKDWAIANGDDPALRIALCGHEGDHGIPDTWECVASKAHGGYARDPQRIANRQRERVWFSPQCLDGVQQELAL